MWSVAELTDQIRALGVGAGDIVLVHSSLRALGLMENRAAGLAEALLEVLGPSGTLVVPTFTQENSRTSRAHLQQMAGFDAQQIVEFEAAMPVFDPESTPSSTGAFGEYVRHLPGALRSTHPQTSYAAVGPLAEAITGFHALESHHGEQSPLARLYEFDAWTLLVGVGFEACSAFHLAEYRTLEGLSNRLYECKMQSEDDNDWKPFWSVVLDDSDFPAVGRDLESDSGLVRQGAIGSAPCRLFRVVLSVDFAVLWFGIHRDKASDDPTEDIPK